MLIILVNYIHTQGRIQDLWLGGVSRGPRGAMPPLKLWGF
jgi:hypothetical protein